MNAVDSNLVDTKLTQLNLILSPDINYRLETMFPKLEGMFAKSGIKNKFKLVQRLEPLMKEMLKENEEVLFISKGVQSSLVEQLVMGPLWAATLNHTAVILTNLRLLCIRTNGKGVPKKTYWSIYYSQIKELKSTMILGNTKIILKDGKKLIYSGFPKLDRKSMRQVFLDAYQLFEEKGFDPPVTRSQEKLCGHCFEVVPNQDYVCESCGATFWKPSQIAIRSFLIPSWGDFVMKHYSIAFVELFGFMFLLLIIAALIFTGDYGLAVLMFFIANSGDAAITALIAAKGLHLKKIPKA